MLLNCNKFCWCSYNCSLAALSSLKFKLIWLSLIPLVPCQGGEDWVHGNHPCDPLAPLLATYQLQYSHLTCLREFVFSQKYQFSSLIHNNMPPTSQRVWLTVRQTSSFLSSHFLSNTVEHSSASLSTHSTCSTGIYLNPSS